MGNREQKKIFTKWISDYQKLIFKVVCAYATEPGDQDDLFQEIALQIWKSIPKFRGESKETTWIYRIALNTAMSWNRKERKHQHHSESLDEHSPKLIRSTEEQDPRLSWLYEQIHQLNSAERSLILLFLDGYSYREMVEILGITESNIGVKISRIKKQLSAKLQQENTQ